MGVIRAAALLIVLAATAAAQEPPPLFLAEERAPVHEAPGGARLASLPPGTKPLEASAVRDGWARIIHRERDAWVPLDALAPLEPRTAVGGLVRDGLVCSGTEPFWSLSVSGASARLASQGKPDRELALGASSRAAGRRYPLRLSLRAGAEGGPWGDAVLEPRLCSDGMSDRTYPWSVSLLPAEGGLRTGCCRLPRAR